MHVSRFHGLILAAAALSLACSSGASQGPTLLHTDAGKTGEDTSADRPWDPGVSRAGRDGSSPSGFDGGPRFGEPCEGHEDCPKGFCVQAGEGRLCTARCVQDCPEGWTCAAVDLFGGSDLTSVCLPREPGGCDGCSSGDGGPDTADPGATEDPGSATDPGAAGDTGEDAATDPGDRPPCGDDLCEPSLGEDMETCPADCAACGDGLCSPGEGPVECPVDCCGGGSGGAGCGDGLCIGYACGEDPATCPTDCGSACGNGSCERGENPEVCIPDCKRFVCGNRVCEPTDGGPEGCPIDCAAACGDCACEAGEDFLGCPIDCGFCGDAVCSMCAHVAEDPVRCPADCAGTPTVERCNGRDDDADGATDEGYPGLGLVCTTEFGPGEITCDESEAATYCLVFALPTEICDGKDNDGDGHTDESTCNDNVRCTIDRCRGADGCAHDFVPGCEAGLGSSEIVILPERLDFGPVLSGCARNEQIVRVYNLSAHTIELETIEIDAACAEPFAVEAAPSLPATVLSGAHVQVVVRFMPGDAGPHTCALLVTTNAFSAPLMVPLSGTTSSTPQQVHTFHRAAIDRADVIFVVDDSASMQPSQDRLAEAAASFISRAHASLDYRLAVVSTDVENRSGELLGEPRWLVSSGDGVAEDIAAAILLGTEGAVAAESGLHSLYLALTPPNSALAVTGGGDPIACHGDHECPSPHGCRSHPSASGNSPSYCGGANSGFLRTDARLEVVFLSDEDDQSPFDVGFYLDAFRRLKGGGAGSFRVHAIVGPLPDGCEAGQVVGSPGHRYVHLAEATFGTVGSICSLSYGGVMELIGASALARRHVFELTRPGVVSAVTVEADGVPCESGWSYREEDHAVHLEPGGACDLASTSSLTVRYRVSCP
jgi:hypothetical protein